MTRRCLSLVLTLALALLGWPPSVPGETAVTDPDVLRGIRQVDEGDYDAAIVTLDGAVRRLAADRSRPSDLPQAYLYLGIAYVGKGHEAAAKSKFREALKQIKDLSLSADKFPPKVINVFEAARDEVSRDAAVAAAAAPATSPAPQPKAAPAPVQEKKKGGGGKALIVLGVVGAGAGVALAAGGGGSTAPSGGGQPERRTESFSGNLGFNENLTFTIDVAGSGALEATLNWTSPDAVLAMDLHLPGSTVASSARTGPTAASLTANVSAQRYSLQVLHRGDPCARAAGAPPCETAFTLRVLHP